MELGVVRPTRGTASASRHLGSQKALIMVLGRDGNRGNSNFSRSQDAAFCRSEYAFAKGWDCFFLKDGCATTSPEFARQCIEFNNEEGWGFILSCEALIKVSTTHSPRLARELEDVSIILPMSLPSKLV